MDVHELVVLYDADCPLCRSARRWLERHRQLVPLRFVPCGSARARAMFPTLDHEATRRDVTVVDDNGGVYVADDAWLMCLWALSAYRGLALRLAGPRRRPLAHRVVAAAAALRGRGTGDRYGRDCDERCARP
jgi:predicted DCC family thiol-disulfide oxidoreductase YuxK